MTGMITKIKLKKSELSEALELMLCEKKFNFSCIYLLLKNGANPNSKKLLDCPPIIVAATEGSIDLLKLILSFNPKIDVINEDDRTALIVATIEGNLKIVKELCIHGADISIKDYRKKTALDYAEEYGYKSIIKYLNGVTKK